MAATHLTISAQELERIASAGWPAPTTALLGEWVLRAAAGISGRANSALAVGDPGMEFGPAAEQVGQFYASASLPAQAQCVVGSRLQEVFVQHAWVDARPAEADTLIQVAAIADVRAAAPSHGEFPAELSPRLPLGWLADDPRARTQEHMLRAIMEGPPLVTFASVRRGGRVLAKGRASVSEGWAGVTDMWVDPAARRRGLATNVLTTLLEWAEANGATSAYLQVVGSNAAARTLYERLGFRTHHAYRYLVAPAG